MLAEEQVLKQVLRRKRNEVDIMLRIIFAILSSVLIICLIPILNKTRPRKDTTIISYRLKSFEPQTLLKEKKLEEEKLIRKDLLEQDLTLIHDPVAPSPIKAPVLNFNLNIRQNFSASGTTGLLVSRPAISRGGKPISVLRGGVSIYSPKPQMPLRAMQLGLSGKVKARFKIDKKGLVGDIKILETSNKIFNSSVIKVLKKYRFSPFLDANGQPVEKIRIREFEFVIK